MFRFVPVTPAEPGERLLHLLGTATMELEGRLTVVRRDRVLQRLL